MHENQKDFSTHGAITKPPVISSAPAGPLIRGLPDQPCPVPPSKFPTDCDEHKRTTSLTTRTHILHGQAS